MKSDGNPHVLPLLPRAVLALLLALAVTTGGCGGGDDDGPADGGTTDVRAEDTPPAGDTPPGADLPAPADVPAADVPGGGDALADGLPGEDVPTPPPEHLVDLAPDLALAGVAGLDGRVRLYRDGWGVPHVYAATRHDAFFAQGFVTAMDRLLQMHLFRMAGAGRMAEVRAMGPGELAGDVYMRTLNLRGAAEATWELVQQPGGEDARLALTAFAEGVNAYVRTLRDGTIPVPTDLLVLGGPAIIQDWTPVDSLVIGRVQSWDLSFDGHWDEAVALAQLLDLQERFGGTPLVGIIDDVFDYRSYTDATVLPPADRKAAAVRRAPRASDLARRPFYARLGRGALRGLERARAMRERTRLFGNREDWGSNSWAVAGAHTASGAALLANDPHLTLRNPSIFYQIHMDTVQAGGDLSLAGVSFPGIPALILGRNANVAWSATVFYADVTDVYVEELVPGTDGAPDAVVFGRALVPLTLREELLTYPKPVGAGCDAMLGEWTEDYDETVEDLGDGRCRVTLPIPEVPHHGPVIPGSRGTDADGDPILLTWKWTGFQPTEDLRAVVGFNLAADLDGFLASARHFGVGNQNWLAVDSHGNIGYGAWMLVPRRPWTEQTPVEYVPWLPLPGTGEAEWNGWVAREDLPNIRNPERGWLVTANNDGAGVTLDGDPLNDGPYHGYAFDIGFRAARIHERLSAAVAAGGVTIPDVQAIQADHRSALGQRLRPALLAALAAQEGEGLTARELEAIGYLADWTLEAEDGAWPDATPQQVGDSIATSIFNAWVTHVTRNVFDNKELAGLPDQFKGRMLVRMIEQPETMATWDPVSGQSLLWDDLSTVDVVETRAEILVRSFREALDFLRDPDVVGVEAAGGFGTDDMTQWRWGRLHTVKLTHPLGGPIPPESEWPDGYPRHGDRFSVDASHSALDSSRYRYRSGPAMRAVYELIPGAPRHECVIPGGQEGRPFTRHYQDEMRLWARNQAHPILHLEHELLPAVEWTLQLAP
jgi:penicillin amidase